MVLRKKLTNTFIHMYAERCQRYQEEHYFPR